MHLTEEVKAKAVELGADLVGIAPVERFAGAPLRMSPEGLLPGAKSVVVAGIHHLDAAVELGGVPTPHDCGPYNTQFVMNSMLDDVSFAVGRLLEERGHRALPIAASNIWRYNPYKDLKVSFAPDLAHRYAAAAAGLGQIGWSGLLLSPEFGPRNRFVSVVTDAELEAAPMYDGEPLCDRCMQCVETCPTDAFRKEVYGINEIKIGGKVFQFPETNKWRCGWAENFGLDLAHHIPERVDERTILRHLEQYGRRGGEFGCCLQFCMTPQRRYYDQSYCAPPRRRKEILESDPEKLLAKLAARLDKLGVDVVALGDREKFDGQELVHPEAHLPDVASVISIGIRVPAGCEGSHEAAAQIRRLLDYASFDAARSLDLAGYAATTATKIQDELVAGILDVYDEDVRFMTVLTSARLPAVTGTHRKSGTLSGLEDLRRFCREAGADLVGFFTVGRFARFTDALEATGLPPRQAQVVEDAGLYYGPFVARVKSQSTRVKRPADRLEGAKSVIVLGVHFPHTALDAAKVTPAETVGPFTFARYEAQRLAGDVAFRLMQKLNDSGHRATFTSGLSGLASMVHSSRGMLPDLRANRFAALLSGLACIGLHGYPITAEFGVRQVFTAVVTDCPLSDDPLYAGKIDCERCEKPCVPACPTAALAGDPVPLRLEGKTFALPRVDCFACDWAKRYCLAAEEGPKYCGLDVDVPLPPEPDASALAAALGGANWGVQKRHGNIVEECLRVCPARGARRLESKGMKP